MRSSLTALLIGGSALLLGACDDDEPTTPQQFATVRLINASSGTTGNVSVLSGTQTLTTGQGLAFQGSQCIQVPVGSRALTFRSGNTDIATTSAFNFQTGQQASVVLFGTGASRTATVLNEPASGFSAQTGQNAIRFINATSGSGNVFATTSTGTFSGSAVASNVAAGGASSGGTSGFIGMPTANVRLGFFTGSTPSGDPQAQFTIGSAGTTPLGTSRVGTVVFTPSVSQGATGFLFTPCP